MLFVHILRIVSDFNALEMTSSEIIDQLLEMNDKEAISDLKLLLQTADLVKFAKHNPQNE